MEGETGQIACGSAKRRRHGFDGQARLESLPHYSTRLPAFVARCRFSDLLLPASSHKSQPQETADWRADMGVHDSHKSTRAQSLMMPGPERGPSSCRRLIRVESAHQKRRGSTEDEKREARNASDSSLLLSCAPAGPPPHTHTHTSLKPSKCRIRAGRSFPRPLLEC